MASAVNVAGKKPDNVDPEAWRAMQQELSKYQGGMTPAQIANASPDQLGNSQEMEQDWAIKAFKHAEVFFKLLQGIDDHSKLKLTKIDNDIYAHFRRVFPDLAVAKVSDDVLKAPAAKALWRTFCNQYNGDTVKDFNFGTLVRLDASQDYSEENSTIVPRIQFLAIEIARCREGCNAAVRTAALATAQAP